MDASPEGEARGPRAGLAAILVPLAALLAPCAQAEQVPAGMVPYDKPVFRNGHRVLWHGPSHGAGAPRAAESGAAKTKDIVVLVDSSEPDQARLAGELAAQASANGFRLKTVSGHTALPALGKAVGADAADLAIVPLDGLAAAARTPPDWRARAPLVARLASGPVAIVASRNVADIAQLAGRKVSIEAADSASAASAALLFDRLGIAAKFINQPLPDGLDDLVAGKVDAVVAIGAETSKNLGEFGRSGNYHLLALPWTPALAGSYAPAELTNADFPLLAKADETVRSLSAGWALVALDAEPQSPREEKIASYAAQFLAHFDTLAASGKAPGWKDVNLAAGVDFWPRLPAAQDWVAQNAGERNHALDGFRTVAQGAAASPQGPSGDDSDKLYDSLMKWRAAQ